MVVSNAEDEPYRARVDAARSRLTDVAVRDHRPAEARAAGRTRASALDAAEGFAERQVRRGDMSAAWAAELVRLSLIGTWLRRTDPPDLVAEMLHAPRIGLALEEVVDAVGAQP